MLSTFIFVLSLYAVSIEGSVNGGYYICSTTNLSQTVPLCVFEIDTDAPANWPAAVSPHIDDRTVGANYMRKVQSALTSIDKGPSPQPLTQGDDLVSSSTTLSGNDWMYVLASEMGMYIRNIIMFNPNQVANDPTAWADVVEPFTDCKIKEHRELDGAVVGYTAAEVYEILSDPFGNPYENGAASNGDVHNQILQLLEEGVIDLVCLMLNAVDTSSLATFNRCYRIRDDWGLTDSQMADCWVAGYNTFFSEAPVHGQTLTTATYNKIGYCTVPSSYTGYNVTGCYDKGRYDGISASECDVYCAEGYYGTPAASCATTADKDADFTLSGCSVMTCISDSTAAGYTSIVETDLDVPSFDVTASCASGYEGTASATACSANGAEYSLSGCSAMTCISDSTTTGYTSIVETSLYGPTFDVTVSCDTDYSGTPSATMCTTDGGEYTLTGCTNDVSSAGSFLSQFSLISSVTIALLGTFFMNTI